MKSRNLECGNMLEFDHQVLLSFPEIQCVYPLAEMCEYLRTEYFVGSSEEDRGSHQFLSLRTEWTDSHCISNAGMVFGSSVLFQFVRDKMHNQRARC